MTFEDDQKHMIAMQPYADEVYKFAFPLKKIKRLEQEKDKPHILDKEFHIDCILTLENGMSLTVQEKFLRTDKAHYDCWTLEYSNNRFNKDPSKEPGEWFKLCTDLYFTGYGDPKNGWKLAYLFKVFDVKEAIWLNKLTGDLKSTGTSRANFWAFPFKDFKEEWLLFKK